MSLIIYFIIRHIAQCVIRFHIFYFIHTRTADDLSFRAKLIRTLTCITKCVIMHSPRRNHNPTGNRHDEGLEEGRKRKDTPVIATSALITVFRDNYESRLARALFIPRALCVARHRTYRFSFTHANVLISARGKKSREERDRSQVRVIACASNAGSCVCSGDGCKQSRRCSLCNANA